MTTLECFHLFLDGIKRERTTTVDPDYWSRLMYSSFLLWMKAKVPAGELVQDRIDDLEQFRVVTDGMTYFNGNVLQNIAPEANQDFVFSLPKHYEEQGHPLALYPTYFRLQNVSFIMTYVDPSTGVPKDSLTWEHAQILRSDKRVVTHRNYYRRAKQGRLYYEIVDNTIRVITEANAVARLMRLEYYRYPKRIWFDKTNPKDHSTETVQPYTPGYGSVPCELPDVQTEEVIKIAVQTFLERNSDERQKTFVQ